MSATEPKNDLDELRDELDKIRPTPASNVVVLKTEPRTLTDGTVIEGLEQAYTQEPLKFFSKMEFLALVGSVIDKAMLEEGFAFGEVLGQMSSTDSFVLGLAKLAKYAPDLLKDLYVIALNIPRGSREWAKYAMEEIDDETGFKILDTFIDQNADAIRDLFRPSGPLWTLGEKLRARFGKDVKLATQQQPPSRRTRRATRSQ